MKRHILPLLTAVLLLPCGVAQVTGTAGPPVAPMGCPIDITIANDTNATISTGACPFIVKDAAGQTVYAPAFCILILINIQSGQTWTTQWNQRDSAGVQVAPGAYTVELMLPTVGTVSLPITLGGASAAVAQLGTMKIGKTRGLSLCSPQDGTYPYVAAASLATGPGIPSCGGVINLAPDFLLQLSLDPTNPIFLNFSGMLDSQGRSMDPRVSVPNDPAIVGLGFVVAFVVVDPTAACVIRRVSASTIVPIQ